jgi:hypothetical protein
MMALDPVEVTAAISTSTAPTTAIQHKDARSATKDDTVFKFFGNERIFSRLAGCCGSLVCSFSSAVVCTDAGANPDREGGDDWNVRRPQWKPWEWWKPKV